MTKEGIYCQQRTQKHQPFHICLYSYTNGILFRVPVEGMGGNWIVATASDDAGRSAVLERIGNDSLTLTLSLASVSPEDSGQYSCAPANTPPARISFHVVTGKGKDRRYTPFGKMCAGSYSLLECQCIPFKRMCSDVLGVSLCKDKKDQHWSLMTAMTTKAVPLFHIFL